MTNNEHEQEQPTEGLGEDPEILKAIAQATGALEDLLRRNNIELDYVEADWRDSRSLIEESHGLILKHPGWPLHYIGGDEFGIDANYVFFTSKPVDDSVVHEAARLIIDEGAELPEPFMPKCPKCGEEIDVLTGAYPATVPAKALIINNGLYIDWMDGIKISDCIDGDVGTWHCPCCDEQLFKAGEEDKMLQFLRMGIYHTGEKETDES